jgi:hypothetical protein
MLSRLGIFPSLGILGYYLAFGSFKHEIKAKITYIKFIDLSATILILLILIVNNFPINIIY